WSLSGAELKDECQHKELSITEKKEITKQLKAEGLKPKHFDNNWAVMKVWLKNHV
ncbi:hypothetical protein LCGC14_1119500, partial [marine sediment metagenome]